MVRADRLARRVMRYFEENQSARIDVDTIGRDLGISVEQATNAAAYVARLPQGNVQRVARGVYTWKPMVEPQDETEMIVEIIKDFPNGNRLVMDGEQLYLMKPVHV